MHESLHKSAEPAIGMASGGGADSPEASAHVSLEGIHGTVTVPENATQFWRNWRAYVGPALLISVGYMDPGNWGTDLAAGAQFKYELLWVVAAASVMAIFLQILSARLGIVTGKDLAQACRDWYPRWTRWPNWLLCELAIGACDLGGSARQRRRRSTSCFTFRSFGR